AAPARLRPARLQADRGAAAQARARALRVRVAPPQVHALPGRAGRMDDRAVGARAVHVLVGLPAPRGRQGPAGEVRGSTRVLGGRRPIALLPRQHVGAAFGRAWLIERQGTFRGEFHMVRNTTWTGKTAFRSEGPSPEEAAMLTAELIGKQAG